MKTSGSTETPQREHPIIYNTDSGGADMWRVSCKDESGEWHELGGLLEVDSALQEKADELERELNLLIVEFVMEKVS